jgi:Holliday junction resolvase RusA-like endonuclease
MGQEGRYLVEIQFTIPGEPEGQGRPRGTRDGHFYTPTKTREYVGMIKMLAFEQMKSRQPMTGPCRVQIIAYQSIAASISLKQKTQMLFGLILPTKKPDLDNIIKAILDGCSKIVFDDDKQVTTINAQKCYSDKPRIEVKIIFGDA